MMIFKAENELREVISLGKSEEVINVFLESYLQGLEYEKCEDKELFELVDVSEQMKQWKLDNYQILRKAIYPNIAEYIDDIVKGDNDATLEYINKCLVVKEKYPKVVV